MTRVRLLWLFVAASLLCGWAAAAQDAAPAGVDDVLDWQKLVKYADGPLVLTTFAVSTLIKSLFFSADQVSGNWFQRFFERDPDRYLLVPLVMGAAIVAFLERQTPEFTWRLFFTKTMVAGVAPAGLFKFGKMLLPTWLSKVMFPNAEQVIQAKTVAVAIERKQEAQG